MKWREIILKTESRGEEVVSAILYSLGANGLLIEDPNEIENLEQDKTNWNYIDESLMEIKFDGILIKSYFSYEEDVDKKYDEIRRALEENNYIKEENINWELDHKTVEDKDWAESWKQYYKPVKLGNRIVIKPSWEDYDLKDGEIQIELDPGMAFGTGTHESTAMCVEALESYVEDGYKIYDIGTGSGILAIVGAKLGGKVVGIDLDPMAVKVAKENGLINKVEDRVEFREGDLLDTVDSKVDLVVSNIIAEVIAIITPDVKQVLKPGGIFISSGIIIEKMDLVRQALVENGFKILEERKLNSWAAFVATIE